MGGSRNPGEGNPCQAPVGSCGLRDKSKAAILEDLIINFYQEVGAPMPTSAEPRTIYFCSQCESISRTNRCPKCENDPTLAEEELEDDRGDADRKMSEIELPTLERAVITISCPHCGDNAFSNANTSWHKKIYSTPAFAVFHCRHCDRFYRYSPIPPQTTHLKIGGE